MNLVLSNALSWMAARRGVSTAILSAAQAAGAGPAGDIETIPTKLLGLMAAGLVADFVLLAWFIRRFMVRPDNRFGLSRIPGRANSLHPLHVLLVMIIWQATAVVAFDFLSAMRTVPKVEARLLAGLAGQAILLAGCLLMGARRFRLGLRRGLGLTTRHCLLDTLRGLIAYLAVLPPCVALLVLAAAMLPPQLVREHSLLAGLRELGPWWQALSVFSAVVMAPLGEELFFRGIVQSFLRRYLSGPGATIVVSSVLFASLHVGILQSVPALFVLALALGYNYERTGRLLPSIVLHAAFNTIFIGLKILG